MAINWLSLPGLHKHLKQNGYDVVRRDGVFVGYDSSGVSSPANDSAINSLINIYEPLAEAKIEKAEEIKREGLSRIQALYPAIQNIDDLELIKDFYLSIARSARQPVLGFPTMISIYTAAKGAISAINAETDWTVVRDYNVLTGPGWP